MKSIKNIINYILLLIGCYLLIAFIVSSIISWRKHNGLQSINRNEIIEYATQFLKDDHLVALGKGLDCSGYTAIVFSKFDIKLPRSSKQQFKDFLTVKNEPQAADLVFFTESNKSVSHVGIILSDSTFIHSPGKKKPVRVDYLTDPYWENRLFGIKTVLMLKD